MDFALAWELIKIHPNFARGRFVKIAYILNTYPQPSHSFIRREMQALERQGLTIVRLAMRRSDADLIDPRDQEEAARTSYILDRGVALLPGLLWAMLRVPRALRMALRLGRRSSQGVLRHLIYLAEAADVTRRARAQGIQHLHAHFGTNAAAVAMLAHALGGPRFSFTTHGPEEFDAPNALSLGEKLDNAAFAVGVSRFGRSQLSRWAEFDTWQRLHVVHCGIEPSAFDAPKPVPSQGVWLVSIGRFVEQKGQMSLVDAMALLDDVPDLHLSLVGDGEMRDDLENAIMRKGLQDRVTLTGWLAQDDVRAHLDAAHALVMPSFAEGLPMVVMEAMAAARPVIATYIAGTPELVSEGETGWLVPAGDAQALAKAIRDMASTPHDRLSEMGQAGRRRVLERHDIDTEATKLAGLFEQAITGRAPSGSGCETGVS